MSLIISPPLTNRHDDAMIDFQALWSIQLQMEAELPHQICAIARQMAALKIARRNAIDRLWHARAEKQRRLGFGVGDPPSTPSARTARSMSTPGLANEAGDSLSTGVVGDLEAELAGEGDGADRVGTLLVRLGQLNGVGVVGVLSLAPKAVATLMLEESSASIEEMNMETTATKVGITGMQFRGITGTFSTIGMSIFSIKRL